MGLTLVDGQMKEMRASKVLTGYLSVSILQVTVLRVSYTVLMNRRMSGKEDM